MENTFDLLQSLARLRIEPDELAELSTRLVDFDDWEELLELCELYGISNIAHRLLKQNSLELSKEIRLPLMALQIRHSAMSDARYLAIQEISECFATHNIQFIALKGLALAPMIYPDEALRPMRDMDILVPKDRLQHAGEALRDLGFDLPENQPSKFMRASHQLPNATKTVNGFTISVEVHHDAFNADSSGSMLFSDVEGHLQTIRWRDIELKTLSHELMLHQVARHLEGVHPGGVLKLINVLDVVEYSEKYIADIDWEKIKTDYSHVINTLKCLQLIVPLSQNLRDIVGDTTDKPIQGVGMIPSSLTSVFTGSGSLFKRLKSLLNPSDWWLYLYYNVEPGASLTAVKLFRHPATVLSWLWMRFYSAVRGG